MNKIINRNTWISVAIPSFVSCNKKRLQNEKIDPFGNSTKARHRDEDYLRHEDPPPIFTKILHDGIIALPRQPIADRVEAIQNFLKIKIPAASRGVFGILLSSHAPQAAGNQTLLRFKKRKKQMRIILVCCNWQEICKEGDPWVPLPVPAGSNGNIDRSDAYKHLTEYFRAKKALDDASKIDVPPYGFLEEHIIPGLRNANYN